MSAKFDIKSHEQLEAMALPIRTEIVEVVSYLGPCSIRDLARLKLAWSPSTCCG